MSAVLTPSLFFSSARPAVIDLPHLITALDAELMAKVVHLTQSTPGLWHLVLRAGRSERSQASL